jgi:hypothetical protein
MLNETITVAAKRKAQLEKESFPHSDICQVAKRVKGQRQFHRKARGHLLAAFDKIYFPLAYES